MNETDSIVFRELPVIEKIVRDETWYEGERRGCYVPPNDPRVRDNVCRVVLRVGEALRSAALAGKDLSVAA
ncbi:MAG: hypothetical protein ACREFX_05100 [Opitutaceae bacterium]